MRVGNRAMAKKRRKRRQASSVSGNGSTVSRGKPALAPAPAKATEKSSDKEPAQSYPSLMSGPTVYPPLATSLGRSFVALTQPALLLPVLLIIPVLWFALRALGLETFPLGVGSMTDVLAMPPVGSMFDMTQAGNIFGLNGGVTIGFWIGAALIRAVIVALLTGALDEELEFGSTSKVGWLRGLRALPAVAAASVFAVCALLVSRLAFAQLFGPGLGFLFFLLSQIAVIFFFGFVPIAAVRAPLKVRPAFQRSSRAARLQGWPRHLLMVVTYYFFVSIFGVPALSSLVPGAMDITANPTFEVWLLVLAVNVLHVAFLGAFADRYRRIEGSIPDESPRRRGRGSRPGPAKPGSSGKQKSS